MPTSLDAAVACGSSGSGPVSSRAPHQLPCLRWLPQGPPCPRWWPACGSRPDTRPGQRSPQTPAWPGVPDTCRPDGGRSGSSGRSIRRSFRVVTTSQRLLKAGPAGGACGGGPRPAAPWDARTERHPRGRLEESRGRDSRVAGGGRSLPQRAPGSSRFETGLPLLFRTGTTTPPGQAGTSHPRHRMHRRWSRPCA